MMMHQMQRSMAVRTTLDIDEAVLAAIKEIARREERTAGAVATDLLRRALTAPVHHEVREPAATYGFVPFVAGPQATPVSNDEVNRIREELGI